MSAVLVTVIVNGRAGTRDTLSRMIRWKIPAREYLSALVPLAVAIGTAAHLSLGDKDFPSFAEWSKINGFARINSWAAFGVVFLANGFGEEQDGGAEVPGVGRGDCLTPFERPRLGKADGKPSGERPAPHAEVVASGKEAAASDVPLIAMSSGEFLRVLTANALHVKALLDAESVKASLLFGGEPAPRLFGRDDGRLVDHVRVPFVDDGCRSS